MKNDDEQQPQRIHGNMAFPAIDLLSPVKTTAFAALGRLHRLTISNRSRWRRSFANGLADLFSELVMHALSSSVDPPLAIHPLHRIPIREVRRQVSPLAARPIPIESRIQEFPAVDRLSPTFLWLRQQVLDLLPLSIRQIAGILHYRYGSFHRD